MRIEELRRAVNQIITSAEETAPVTIQIGSTDKTNQVLPNTLSIISAPPRILEDLQKAGFMIGIESGKAYVS